MAGLELSSGLAYMWIQQYKAHYFLRYNQSVVEELVWRYIVHSKAVRVWIFELEYRSRMEDKAGRYQQHMM